MALIKCEECGGMVSDKATSCPHCGCSINSEAVATVQQAEIQEAPKPQFPDLPAVMNVGKQIVNWGFNAAIQDVQYSYSLNNLTYIPEGKISVLAHTNGIALFGGMNFFYIHHNQIIDLKCVPYQQFQQEQKSVIGRAVVGGLLLGPIGAIVGGMSGLGTKVKSLGKFALIINFWDVYSHQIQSIIIPMPNACNDFIAKVNEEKSKANIPDGSNYVVNIFSSETELDNDKLITALRETNLDVVTNAMTRNGSFATNEINDKIQEIASKKNFDMSQVKASGGCMVTAFAILSGLSTLVAMFAFIIL